MPSTIDPTLPEEGVLASKGDMRANWAASKAEIEHGGFFTAPGTGAIERTTASALAETVRASDFGALGDSSATTVDKWLSGSTYSRGAADLAELRAMTGIADLELTDTIDWAAITMALAAAGQRPVLLLGTDYHVLSRSVVIARGGLLGPPSYPAKICPVAHTFNLIHLKPPANARIILKDLYLTGGTNTVYGDGTGGAGSSGSYLNFHSVFDNLQIGGFKKGDGFFFDNLQAIGVRFNNIRAEGCVNGLRFRGQSMLNASQIINCRGATCSGCGMLFENTADSIDTPAVVISGVTVEYNYGPGIKLDGYMATLISPHFEGNDNDQSGDGPDLLLSSSGELSASRVHSVVAAISPYFSSPRHPQGIRISGSANGTQTLVLVAPTIRGGVIDAAHLGLTVIGALGPAQILNRSAAFFGTGGLGLTGAKTVGELATSIGVPAAASATGVLKVLAARNDAGGAAVAEYLIRRNTNGTIAAMFQAGTDFMTFGVDGNGNITAAVNSGQAALSVYGF